MIHKSQIKLCCKQFTKSQISLTVQHTSFYIWEAKLLMSLLMGREIDHITSYGKRNRPHHFMWEDNLLTSLHIGREIAHITSFGKRNWPHHFIWEEKSLTSLHMGREIARITLYGKRNWPHHFIWEEKSLTSLHMGREIAHITSYGKRNCSHHFIWEEKLPTSLHMGREIEDHRLQPWDEISTFLCTALDDKLMVLRFVLRWPLAGNRILLLLLLIAFIQRYSLLSSRLTAPLSQLILNEWL